MIRGSCLIGALVLGPQAAFADPSLECSVGSGSQIETAACLAEAEEAVTSALHIMLDEARRSAAELDGITGRTVAVPALDAAQSAWEAYRDAQCDYAGALFGGGSGTGIEIRSCRIEMARARTELLEASFR